MSRSMELEVWGGDWGLPSIDINCLQIMVYSKFCGAPIQTKIRNNPFRGPLPTFRHGNAVHHSLQEVVNYLRTKNLDADLPLTSKHVSEIQAYKQLLKEKLYPGLQFVWWVDNRNHSQITRPWYSKAISFPFNFYYPGRYETQAKELITALYGPLDEELGMIETQVYSDAEKCLTLLSNRLGDSKYFFGNQPTSLDAIVYSYLAPLLKTPFPNSTLQNHLKACTNLVTFVARISQKYYPNISQEYEKKKQEEMEKSSYDEEFPHRRRNQILAALFATTAMAGYALSSGMFEVSFSPEEETHDLTILDTSRNEDEEDE